MHCPNCGAANPAGSRFCNTCGTPATAGGAYTQTRPPAAPAQRPATPGANGHRTAQPQQPHVTQHPNPHATQQPYYQQPQVTQQFAAPVAEPPRRPVWLLATLLVLLIAGLGTAGVMVFRRAAAPVTGGATPEARKAPGVQTAVTPDLPAGPGVVASGADIPSPSPPVTSAAKDADTPVPGVLMAPGAAPRPAPGVLRAQTPEVPRGMGPTHALTPLPQASNPMEVRQAPVRPSQPTRNEPPAPRDNRDFDAYLRWLQFVDRERAGLRAQGETEIMSLIAGNLNDIVALADPDYDPGIAERNRNARLQMLAQRVINAMRMFRQNILRTKPPVPADCRQIDLNYMTALDQETRLIPNVLLAWNNKDIGALRRVLSSDVKLIDRNLGYANRELQRTARQREFDLDWQIETGGASGGLGGIGGGMPGLF